MNNEEAAREHLLLAGVGYSTPNQDCDFDCPH